MVQFCKDFGMTKFILKCDTLQVVNNLAKKETDWSQGGLLIQDARNILNSFADWFMKHVNKKANHVGHTLAKDATSIDSLYEMDLILDCIRREAYLDCMEIFE